MALTVPRAGLSEEDRTGDQRTGHLLAPSQVCEAPSSMIVKTYENSIRQHPRHAGDEDHLSRRMVPIWPFVPIGRFVALLHRISVWGYVVK